MSYNYVRNYFSRDSSALCSVIYSWCEDSPSYLEIIYGDKLSEYIFSNPVIHLAINNINAIKYFIDYGADVNSCVYLEDYDFTGTPLEYAKFVRDQMKKMEGENNEVDLKEMDIIISYLEKYAK